MFSLSFEHQHSWSNDAIKETRIKTNLRFHLISSRITNIKKKRKKENWPQMLERIRGKGNLYSMLVGLQILLLHWKSVWRLFKNLKTNLLYNPAIPLLGKCPKSSTSCSTDICSAMFAAALFTIVRKSKEPICAQVLLLTCIVSKTSQHQQAC